MTLYLSKSLSCVGILWVIIAQIHPEHMNLKAPYRGDGRKILTISREKSSLLERKPAAATQSLEEICGVDLPQSLCWICSALSDVEPQQDPQLQSLPAVSWCVSAPQGWLHPHWGEPCLGPCSRRGYPHLQHMNQSRKIQLS